MVPVIGLLSNIEDYKPVPNPDEVDAIFDVPLEMFLKVFTQHDRTLYPLILNLSNFISQQLQIFQGENYRVKEREWKGCKYILHHFDFETSKQGVFPICGLTASILIRAASVIFQRSPCFNQHHHHLPDFQQLQRALIEQQLSIIHH